MTNDFEIYKCKICGGVVSVRNNGSGKLLCCRKKMILQKSNTVDTDFEKHVPVLEQVDDISYKIKIGSIEHPMTNEHFIEWIEIFLSNDTSILRKLYPFEKPEFIFATKANVVSIKAYCNLHGLWKKDIEQI